LLFADFAFFSRSGICGQFSVSDGCEAVLAWSVDPIYRLWVLSILASEKMPAPAQRDRLPTAVGSCALRSYFDLLSASDGKRLG
jgi:hypothetical protein